MQQGNHSERIVVAMSGGVDSSVAALILKEQGYDALGVSMQVWDYRNNGGCQSKATCCSPDDFTDARKVAGKLDIPYYVFDFEASFKEKVIDKFVNSYAAGLTPNPCVDCNNKVKFRELRERAEAFGCSRVATGHYARIMQDSSGLRLLRGRDDSKDQSYFLYGVTSAELRQTVFPVGDLTKDEVREIAREAGLVTASKPESQDICFVAGSVQDFLVQLGGKKRKGLIVRRDGSRVGEHDGIQSFTVGQRRGLRIGGTENPLYVLELIPSENLVVVGEKHELESESFVVNELNWISPEIAARRPKPGERLKALAQVRHRHRGVPVEIEFQKGDCVKVFFSSDWTSIAPGQAAVFYDLENQEVFGGGRIAPAGVNERELKSVAALA